MARKKSGLIKRARVQQVIEHYKPLVGLADWTYTLTMDMSGQGDLIAAVRTVPYRKQFHMVFAPRAFAQSSDPKTTLENTIVHELLHVLIWPLLSATAAEGDTDRIQWVTEHLEEPFIDPLAKTMARYLPKPR